MIHSGLQQGKKAQRSFFELDSRSPLGGRTTEGGKWIELYTLLPIFSGPHDPRFQLLQQETAQKAQRPGATEVITALRFVQTSVGVYWSQTGPSLLLVKVIRL